MSKPLVYVALDHDAQIDNINFAKELVSSVEGEGYGFKINLDSFFGGLQSGDFSAYQITKIVKDFGKPVFADLKMWNGGRTMANLAKGFAELGVDKINMYTRAGKKFVSKVLNSLENSNTKLFGLTVLTHYTDEDTQRLYGCNFSEAVAKFGEEAAVYGAHGIILPGTELNQERIKNLNILKLCPGIRPEWYANKKDNLQEQIVTPTAAVKGGANYLVIGSPIRKSPDPSEALEKILEEVEEASK